jgi:hypothetical protein
MPPPCPEPAEGILMPRLRLSHLPFVLDVRRPRCEQREQRQRTDQPDECQHPTVATQDEQLLAHDCADHA